MGRNICSKPRRIGSFSVCAGTYSPKSSDCRSTILIISLRAKSYPGSPMTPSPFGICMCRCWRTFLQVRSILSALLRLFSYWIIAWLSSHCRLFRCLMAWIIVYRKYASTINHEIRERISAINGMINEAIQGMTIIRAFRRQKETTEEFEQLNEEYTHYQNKLLSLNSLTSHNLMNVVRNLFFFGLIWYVGRQFAECS